jgi:hypothetical protein
LENERGCTTIKSYTDTCILFNSKKIYDFDYWKDEIKFWGDDMFFVLVEVSKRDVEYQDKEIGRFKSIQFKHTSLSKNFDELVEGELDKD